MVNTSPSGSGEVSGVPPSEDVSGDSGKHGQLQTKIGGIELKDEFSDPNVEVNHSRLTAEHEIVPGHTAYTDEGVNFVLQAMGRKPPEITIDCWVTQTQLSRVDNIIAQDRIDIETTRYIGEAVPEDVDVEYSRVYHEVHGWIYNVKISLFGTTPTNMSNPQAGAITAQPWRADKDFAIESTDEFGSRPPLSREQSGE